MHVDRTRFLLLVSAIAAGCGPRTATNTPVAPPAPDAGATPLASPTATVAHKDNYPPPIAEEGYPPPMMEGSTPPTTEGSWPTGPVYEGGSTWEGGGPPKEGGPPPTLEGMGIPVSSWTCAGSDDVGKPAYCAVKVPKSCAPFPFVHSSCNGARKYFKAKVAERAVSCMNKLKGDAVCAAMTYDCKEAALRSACPDPSADAVCQGIVQKCPKAKVAECKRYVAGLNAAGRAKVEQCMTGPGCGWGVYSCVEGLND